MRKFHVISLLLAITLTGCGNVAGTLKWTSQSHTSISDYDFKTTQEQALLASSSPNCETGVPRFKAWTSGFVLDVSDPGNVVVGEIHFFFNSDRKFTATYREFQGGSESFNETVQGTFDFQTGELTVPGFGRGAIDVLGDRVVFQFSLTSTRHSPVGSPIGMILRAVLKPNPAVTSTCQ
jgi:hypothetical protein